MAAEPRGASVRLRLRSLHADTCAALNPDAPVDAADRDDRLARWSARSRVALERHPELAALLFPENRRPQL